MRYQFYQTFENNDLYDRFLAAVKKAGIPYNVKLLEAGNNNSLGLPEAVQYNSIAGLVVFSSPITCFNALNTILEPLVQEYHPVTAEQAAAMPAGELKRKFRQVYGVNKIEFYTIRQALVLKNQLPDSLEEAEVADNYLHENLQKKMSLGPVWVMGALSALFITIGFIPGPLVCVMLVVYAYNRRYKKQELPDGSIINLYDADSVKKASVLLPAAIVLLLISIGMLVIKFSG